MRTYRVSETFLSIQGEGKYTGQLTSWVRFFSCNLQCPGFSQPDPANPATYIDPLAGMDIKSYKSMAEVPIITRGCDSAYSVSSKFKHLCPALTPQEIADQLIQKMPHHVAWDDHSKNHLHMAFTGGEPLLPAHQEAAAAIMLAVNSAGAANWIENVTFETNGTQSLTLDFKVFFAKPCHYDVMFSVSPKLYTVSGEKRAKAIKPEVVADYNRFSDNGQLKFVLANEQRCWDELEEVIDMYRDAGVYYPVWIMPVGSSKEQQESRDVMMIADEAMKRGYNVSARVHSLIFGNGMGR